MDPSHLMRISGTIKGDSGFHHIQLLPLRWSELSQLCLLGFLCIILCVPLCSLQWFCLITCVSLPLTVMAHPNFLGVTPLLILQSPYCQVFYWISQRWLGLVYSVILLLTVMALAHPVFFSSAPSGVSLWFQMFQSYSQGCLCLVPCVTLLCTLFAPGCFKCCTSAY